MLRLKLTHVSKRGPRHQVITWANEPHLCPHMASLHDELNEMHDQTAALRQGVHLGIDNANIAFHVYLYYVLARVGWLSDPLRTEICWQKGWGHQQPNLPNSHRISWFQLQGSYTITRLSQDTARTEVSSPLYLLEIHSERVIYFIIHFSGNQHT